MFSDLSPTAYYFINDEVDFLNSVKYGASIERCSNFVNRFFQLLFIDFLICFYIFSVYIDNIPSFILSVYYRNRSLTFLVFIYNAASDSLFYRNFRTLSSFFILFPLWSCYTTGIGGHASVPSGTMFFNRINQVPCFNCTKQ